MVESGFLGIGSNVGEREAAVLRALRILDTAEGLSVVNYSALYETEPEGGSNQPYFINGVAEVKSLLYPRDLLLRIKMVEVEMGRRGVHNSPREIDIDLISLGNTILSDSELTIPHPRYRERPFVLIPLREISPAFVCPEKGIAIDELINSMPSGGSIVEVSSRSLVFK